MKLCKLHYGLQTLANSEGIIYEKFETIAAKIFNDSKIKIEPILTILEKSEILVLEGDPLYIRLLPWPEFGQRESATKGDCLRESYSNNPIPSILKSKSSIEKRKQFKYENRLQKAGLTGFTRPPAFEAFLKAWPNPITDPKAIGNALTEWNKLDRTKKLPDISSLILALRKNPPGPRSWPNTWLKKNPWNPPRRYAPLCPVCNDETRVYGITPEGKKGAVPCPRCQKPK